MSGFSSIRDKLRDKAYREAFVASQLKRGLPTQMRVMLKDRGWKQEVLAQRSGLKQGVISRATDPDYGNLTINTILKIASGFDVAYVGRFVPFSELARWYSSLSEDALSVPSFEDDPGVIERKPQASAMVLASSLADLAQPQSLESSQDQSNLVEMPKRSPQPSGALAALMAGTRTVSSERPQRELGCVGSGR